MGWALAVQGAAGAISSSLPPESWEPRLATLHHCLDLGSAALRAGRPALDVVELVVRELENCPHFNAGRGSVLTADGTVEMEACIMEGRMLRCGAVSGLSTVVNPISLSRLVMEKTPHIYLAFGGAEAFAREQGVDTKDPIYFITRDNIERLRQEKEASKLQSTKGQSPQEIPSPTEGNSRGTVGCVAVDAAGNLATATSTGGRVNIRHVRQRAVRGVGHGQGRGDHPAHGGARRRGGDGALWPAAAGRRGACRYRRAPGHRRAGGRVGHRGGVHGVQHHRHVQGVRHRGRAHRDRHLDG